MATTKSIKGTRTEKNLVTAYAAESMAYTRYTYYAQQADKENYFPIGVIFRETADNELHHGLGRETADRCWSCRRTRA
jgi:rubrerythrin